MKPTCETAKHAPGIRYFVRCLAGGCVIGSRDENDFGAPLTKREANKIAKFENERSARRREQRLGGNFDYYVDEVKPQSIKP